MHGGDGYLRAIEESHDDAEVVLQRAAHVGGIGPALADSHVEVEAGGEGAPGADHEDRAHGVVGLGHVERSVERLDHRPVDCIQLVRPIERQHGEPVAVFGMDHASLNHADFDCV